MNWIDYMIHSTGACDEPRPKRKLSDLVHSLAEQVEDSKQLREGGFLDYLDRGYCKKCGDQVIIIDGDNPSLCQNCV